MADGRGGEGVGRLDMVCVCVREGGGGGGGGDAGAPSGHALVLLNGRRFSILKSSY